VFQEYTADLPHLVGFGVAPSRLQIHESWHARVSEDPVTTADALCEAEATQDEAQVLEADRRIAASAEDSAENLIRVPHALIVGPERCRP